MIDKIKSDEIILSNEDLRDKYNKETGKTAYNPNWMDSSYTDDYTEWLEEYLLKLLNILME